MLFLSRWLKVVHFLKELELKKWRRNPISCVLATAVYKDRQSSICALEEIELFSVACWDQHVAKLCSPRDHLYVLLMDHASLSPLIPASSNSCVCVCVCVYLSLQSRPAFCDLWTIAHQACLSSGTLQARILEWVVMPSSGDLRKPGIKPTHLISLALEGRFFSTSATWEALFQLTAHLNSLSPIVLQPCICWTKLIY